MKKILPALLLSVFVQVVSGQPNILLINVDDMGWKDAGFLGSRYYETPNMDALAADGMVFTSGYAAASNCAPSRACLMSGQWTPRHGIYTVGSSQRGESKDRMLIPAPNETVLADDFITLAEVLQGAGYNTCHAGKWHLGDDPCSQGFDVNIGGSHAGAPLSYYHPYKNVEIEDPGEGYLTDIIMSKTIDFIESAGEKPFFLYYAPYAVHAPIQPVDSLIDRYRDKPAREGQKNPEYATMLDNLDRNLGDLIAVLKEKAFYENTLIIFTSDNGGHIGGITKQNPLRAGKGSYYEGGIREPFVVVWPGVVEPASTSDVPVCNLDIYPTLMEVTGLTPPSGYTLDGKSFLSVLEGERSKALKKRPLYWHFPIYLQAYNGGEDESRDPLFRTRPGSVIRKGNWKLHQYFEDGGLELYHLGKDIGERNNLAGKKKRRLAKLLAELEAWREKTGAPVPTRLNPDYNGTISR